MPCVNVLVIGDYGSRNFEQRRVAKGLAKVAEEQSVLSIHGVGDNIYSDGAEGDPTLIATYWRDVYTGPYTQLRRPWYIVTGNHDWRTDARTERDFTKHPLNTGSWWRMPDFWYTVTHTSSSGVSVDIFHIDTQLWKGSSGPEKALGPKARQTQIDWLSKGLAGSTATWKIVCGHHPVYSAGSHGITQVLLDELDPLMRQNGVAMFFAGHDHSKQIIQYQDLTYVISGAGGKRPRERRDEYPPGSLKHIEGNLGFVGVSFCESQAIVTLYDEAGVAQTEMTVSPPSGARPSAIAGFLKKQAEPCGGVLLHDVDTYCSACRVVPDQADWKTCKDYCDTNGLLCENGWAQGDFDDECVDGGQLVGCDAVSGSGPLLCECR